MKLVKLTYLAFALACVASVPDANAFLLFEGGLGPVYTDGNGKSGFQTVIFNPTLAAGIDLLSYNRFQSTFMLEYEAVPSGSNTFSFLAPALRIRYWSSDLLRPFAEFGGTTWVITSRGSPSPSTVYGKVGVACPLTSEFGASAGLGFGSMSYGPMVGSTLPSVYYLEVKALIQFYLDNPSRKKKGE